MFFKTPKIIKKLLPNYIWNIPTKEKKLYITFDDGPIPEVTEWILEELDKYKAKATFFCVGDNVRKYPEIYQKVLNKGHAVGNHTFNHLSGWTTKDDKYIDNIGKCQDLVNSDLLRPPYGRIKKSQYKKLKGQYKIIMWNILAWDFMKNLDQKNAVKQMIKKTKRGDIVLFHDSQQSIHNLKYMLPKYLEYFSKIDFEFCVIPQKEIE